MFVFEAGVSLQERADRLARMNQWDEVYKAGLLHPDAKKDEQARVGYAYLNEQTDLQAAVERIAELPEVASASVPARRKFS